VKPRLAIFDLDDTLVDTSDVYWRSRTAFLDVVARAGFERGLALEEFESLDGQNITKYGYIPERYETSMVETYADLCGRAGSECDPATVEAVRRAGRIVQTESPTLIDGAIELLDGVRDEGMRVVLVTRGVDRVQRQKIASHNLRGHFDQIEVVVRDKAELFSRLIAETGAVPADCWVIGDSVRSDINPGIQAGANCILYLYTHHSYHWRQEYGVQPQGSFYVARTLHEVLETLRSPHLKVPALTVPERDPNLSD
jgi:putative hydrolase of the HAD superfamily